MSRTSVIITYLVVTWSPIGEGVRAQTPARPLADDVSEPDGSTIACGVDADCVRTLLCLDGACYVRKNRYVSMRSNPANAGLMTARRVSLVTDDGPVVLGWVSEPRESEPRGAIPPQWVARIEPAPFHADWTAFGTVHVGDCEVSPQHEYLIQAIELNAPVDDEGSFSDALALPTADAWGDVVALFAATFSAQPNLTDIARIFDGFLGDDSAPPMSWLDLEPEFPDARISILDLHDGLLSFQSRPYRFRDPLDCPSADPVCGDGIAELPEQCDDGNTDAGDGCGSFCRIEDAAAATMRMAPLRASGIEGVDWFLESESNGIRLVAGDQDIVVELVITLAGAGAASMFQATLDCAGFHSGDVGVIDPLDRICSFDEFAGFCTGVNADSRQTPSPFIDSGMRICSNAQSCDNPPASGRISCGAAGFGSVDVEPNTPLHGAQFAFHVSPDARGTFLIGLDPDPSRTVIRETNGANIGSIAFVPARISVAVARCERASVFGDIVSPFADDGPPQPDFTDIAAVVDCFSRGADCPADLRDRADLDPCIASENICFGDGGLIDFSDISRAVDAFTGDGCLP